MDIVEAPDMHPLPDIRPPGIKNPLHLALCIGIITMYPDGLASSGFLRLGKHMSRVFAPGYMP